MSIFFIDSFNFPSRSVLLSLNTALVIAILVFISCSSHPSSVIVMIRRIIIISNEINVTKCNKKASRPRKKKKYW